MTADEGDVVVERQDFRAQRRHQRLVIALRQVSAPDRTAEQHVAHQREALRDPNRVAQRLGCVDELNLVPGIIEQGAAYQRQRAIYERTGDWRDVVDATVAELRG